MDLTRLALCPEDRGVGEPRAAVRAEVHPPFILHAARGAELRDVDADRSADGSAGRRRGQSTGLRLAMGRRAPPKRPTSSSIGPKMRAPRQMNGNAGIRRVTTPAKVKKAPTSTWRRIKGSPRDCIVWGRHEASEVTARTRDARAISDSCAAPTPPAGRGRKITDSCTARFPGSGVRVSTG